MNTDEIQVLGMVLQRRADEISRMASVIDALVASAGANWVGPDATRFQSEHWPSHRACLAALSEDLHGFGQSALNNASEQAAASGVYGSSPATPLRERCIDPHPAVNEIDRAHHHIGNRLPPSAHASTSDYVSEITHLRPGEIAVRHISDGPPSRYVVMLRGLEIVSAGSNDVGTTVADFLSVNSDYQQAIHRALDSIPADAEIGIVGHSQGGLAAVEMAQGDPRITDVLALGSPVDGRDLPAGVSVLSVENTKDAVPKLDISLLPGDVDGRIDRVAFTTDSLDPRAPHGIHTSYLQAIERMETRGGHSVTFAGGGATGASWLASFESRFGGDGRSGAAHRVGQPETIVIDGATY